MRFTPDPLQARGAVALVLALALLTGWPGQALAQSSMRMLANPAWNITLTDYGYSDFLLDNTPGFEGREYLSGEWGIAVGYSVDDTPVAPIWLEPQWVYPDWTTNSNFQVVSPITALGVSADDLPIAEAVIANPVLRITLRYEMLDTVTGTPMGVTPATVAGSGTALSSNRYVLKQTCTVKNISAGNVTNLQLFQLLHGLSSQRGQYDNRLHSGTLGEFQYDTTLGGVDPWSAGPNTSSAGLEDYLAFHAHTAPDAFEIGYFGVEGNGVDSHAVGKPSEGVHLSVEDNWQHPPYLERQGTAAFQPAQGWVAGAQRWTLGSLAPDQTVSHDLLLTILTGTRVTAGSDSAGKCNGGSEVAGGIDCRFTEVTTEGSCFGSFSRADDAELHLRVARGEFAELTFPTPGRPAQIWNVAFNGSFSGEVGLTFGYDASLLPPGFDENSLTIYHFQDGSWLPLGATVDLVSHRIAVGSATFGAFALAIGPAAPACAITASAAPPASGTLSGAGSYPAGAGITLVASAAPGYAFVNWTDDNQVVGSSPTLVFAAAADRTLVANFIALGDKHALTTSSLPSHGGTTSGGGAYTSGASATLSALAAPGYKFSKWLVDGVETSSNNPYACNVSADLAVVAKFKPVFSVVTAAKPAYGGEIEADATYAAGELAELKALALPGFWFVNWTQNGLEVSTQATFHFNVTANCTLVANFAQGNRIDARAEPAAAGSVSGTGVYQTGELVTLTAAAKPGYLFINWSDTGREVSTTQTYTFNATASSTVLANFIAFPNISIETPAPGTLMIAWPAGADDWRLQESASLAPGSWADSTRPVVIEGNQKQVIIGNPAGAGFFRLKHP